MWPGRTQPILIPELGCSDKIFSLRFSLPTEPLFAGADPGFYEEYGALVQKEFFYGGYKGTQGISTNNNNIDIVSHHKI